MNTDTDDRLDQLGQELAGIRTPLVSLGEAIHRITSAIERLARLEESASAQAEAVTRLWDELEVQERRLVELGRHVQRASLMTPGGQWLFGVVLGGAMMGLAQAWFLR